jgi:hypothetical protein
MEENKNNEYWNLYWEVKDREEGEYNGFIKHEYGTDD